MSLGRERYSKMKKGLIEKADSFLIAFERGEYEIDGTQAGDYVMQITESLREDIGASRWERWRSKKSYQVTFANRFAAAKTNYEKFRAADDVFVVKTATEFIDCFNIGLGNGIIRRRAVMDDPAIRGLILSDMYKRKREGREILNSPVQYAELLSVSPEVASFDLEYLLQKGLVQGEAISTLGTTKKIVMVHNITAYGMEAVEGRRREQLEINFNVVNVTAPFTGQIAAGENIVQTQSVTINSFAELHQYVERALTPDQAKTLRPLLEEVESQVGNDSVKPSTLRRIGSLLATYGPVAVPIADFIARLLGVKM